MDARMQGLEARKQDLEQKVQLNPEARIYWVQLGNVCKELGDKERAIEAFRKALELKPGDSFLKKTLDELEGKNVSLPIGKQRPMTPAPVSEPPILKKKHYIIAGVMLAAILASIFYAMFRWTKVADTRRVLETNQNQMHPKVSPDGKWIAFVAQPQEENIRSPSVIYVASADGKETTTLFTESEDLKIAESEAVWLPDSSGFIVELRDDYFKAAYYVLRTDGAEKRPLNLQIPPMDLFRPAVSPDGKQIAYVVKRKEDYSEYLIVADMGTGTGTEIANFMFIRQPAWSPRGDLIAFCSEHYDKAQSKTEYEIQVVRPNGTGLTAIDDAKNDCEPTFFGSENLKLAYLKGNDLYYVNVDTLYGPTSLLPSTYNGRVTGDLAVSADLKVLAFVVVVGRNVGIGGGYTINDIFLLKEGKTEPFSASEYQSSRDEPSLSPDGKWMAFRKFLINPRAPMQVWAGGTTLD